MNHETVPCHLTTMVMAKRNDEVVVLERKKFWQGITFPGGHVESGEAITECAKREFFEETGLKLKEIKLKSIVDWHNSVNEERFFVFCYISTNFEGELKEETEEGKVFFMPIKDLENSNLCQGFKEQLPIFLDEYNEYFGTYGTGVDNPVSLY